MADTDVVVDLTAAVVVVVATLGLVGVVVAAELGLVAAAVVVAGAALASFRERKNECKIHCRGIQLHTNSFENFDLV